MLKRRRMPVCGLVGLLAVAAGVQAGDLKTRLPQSTVGFLEYTGTAACKSAYETTPLARMTSDPDMARLIDAAWPALSKFLIEQAGQEGQEAQAEAGLAVGVALWRKGFVVDLIEVGMGPMGPAPALVIATEQGAEAEAFAAHVETLLADAPMPPPTDVEVAGKTLKERPLPAPGMTLRYGVVDGVFVAMVGEQTPERVLAALAGGGENLAGHPGLLAEMAKIGTADRQHVLLGFADIAGLLAQLETIAGAMTGGEGFAPPVERMIEELGVAGMTRATVCMQIADGGFRTTWRLGTQGERKGLLKLVEQAALTDADIQWLPRDASFGAAINFDLAAAYDEIMRVLGMLPMIPQPLVEGQLAAFKESTGLDLRADILDAAADGWAFFNAPSAGGVFFTNFAIVVEVKHEAAVTALLKRGIEALSRLMAEEGQEIGCELVTSKRNGVEVNFLQFVGLPIPAAPAWSMHDGHVVFGFTPQIVRNVVTRVKGADARAASLLENPDFVRGREKLPAKLTAVSYVNTKAGMQQVYPWLALAATGATGMLRAQGVAVDADVVPEMSSVMPGMFGTVWGMTVDAEAVTRIGYGPTPVAVPEFGGAGLASTAMMTSILLPSLSRARALSKRVVGASNLKEIGVACAIHAYDHQGQYPADLQTLIDGGMITAKSLEDPAGPGGPSYTYIVGHTTNSDPRWVVAYEDHDYVTDEGANVLFADGHVEFVKPLARAHELIAQTRAEMAAKAQP